MHHNRESKTIIVDATNIINKPTGAGQFAYHTLQQMASSPIANTLTILVRHDLADTHPLFSLNLHFKKVGFGTLGITRDVLLSAYLYAKRKNTTFFSFMPYLPWYSVSPAIVTVHDIGHLHLPYFRTTLHKWYFRWVYRRSMNRASHILTVSNATKTALTTYFSLKETPVTVVQNASTLTEKDCLSAEASLHDKPYILFVGERRPHKNLHRLLTAFAVIAKQVEHDVVLVGKEYQQETALLRTHADSLGIRDRVHIIDSVSHNDLITWYKHASVFVLISEYEGFGMPIVEAMTLGVPVVTGNHSAMAEVAGDAALLVDVYDEQAIAQGIYNVLTDETCRNKLCQKGTLHAKTFSWDQVTRSITDVLREYV